MSVLLKKVDVICAWCRLLSPLCFREGGLDFIALICYTLCHFQAPGNPGNEISGFPIPGIKNPPGNANPICAVSLMIMASFLSYVTNRSFRVSYNGDTSSIVYVFVKLEKSVCYILLQKVFFSNI